MDEQKHITHCYLIGVEWSAAMTSLTYAYIYSPSKGIDDDATLDTVKINIPNEPIQIAFDAIGEQFRALALEKVHGT